MQGKGHGEIHLRGWYWPFEMLYNQGQHARVVRPPCVCAMLLLRCPLQACWAIFLTVCLSCELMMPLDKQALTCSPCSC